MGRATPTTGFASRLRAARAAHGPLVLGLDPSAAVLRDWRLSDDPDGLERFADLALAAAAGAVGLVKAQSAFYERHGWRGMRTLERLVAEARAAGLLVIVDAKRGDVGSTNEAYASAYFGPGAPLACDALTVHPYLGLGAMGPLVDGARSDGAGLLVVVRSSNPEGRTLQAAAATGGRRVEQQLLDEIGELNGPLAEDGIGPVGAVVSAVRDLAPLELRRARAVFLVPGVGAQGTTPEDVAEVFAACPERVMPSASRSLLAHGPDTGRLREAIGEVASAFATLLPAG